MVLIPLKNLYNFRHDKFDDAWKRTQRFVHYEDMFRIDRDIGNPWKGQKY